MNQLAEDLKATKAVLLEKGRSRERAEGEDGSVCLIYAFHDAIGLDNEAMDDADYDTQEDRWKAWRDALLASSEASGYSIVGMNEAMTDEQVFAAFDRAIAEAEKKGT